MNGLICLVTNVFFITVCALILRLTIYFLYDPFLFASDLTCLTVLVRTSQLAICYNNFHSGSEV